MADKEKKREGKKKKLHLHQVRTVAVEDGSHVHHHTYKDKKGDPYTHPERENVATSATPEEAGQHVEDAFAQNEQGQGDQQAAPEPEEAQAGSEPMPGAGAPAAGA